MEPPAWWHRVLIIAPRLTAAQDFGESRRAYRGWRRKQVIGLGVLGVLLLLVFGHPFEHWVTSWADGSLRLQLLGIELIPLGANFFVSFLAQAYNHKGPDNTFRLNWGMIARQLLVAEFFLGLIEGVYYAIALPSAVPGSHWQASLLRGIIDQPVSLIFLDPINQFLKFWLVERNPKAEALQKTRQTLLSFYLRSAPAWFLLVIAANRFTNPIYIFMIVSIAMILWDFQLYTTPHDIVPSRLDKILSWPLFRQIQSIIDSKWFATGLAVELAAAYFAAGAWLAHPLWASFDLVGLMLVGTAAFVGLLKASLATIPHNLKSAA